MNLSLSMEKFARVRISLHKISTFVFQMIPERKTNTDKVMYTGEPKYICENELSSILQIRRHESIIMSEEILHTGRMNFNFM